MAILPTPTNPNAWARLSRAVDETKPKLALKKCANLDVHEPHDHKPAGSWKEFHCTGLKHRSKARGRERTAAQQAAWDQWHANEVD